MNLMIVPVILVCSSFLISVYVYCVESFAHIEGYSDSSRRWSHLVEPFATVLFNVCSVVTVECCVWYVCCYVRKKASSTVS